MCLKAASGRTLHLAGRGRAGHVGLVVLDRDKGVARAFGVDGVLAASLLPLGNEQTLLELMVGLAHFDLAVEALELHAFQHGSDLGRLGGLGLGKGFGQHGKAVVHGAGVHVIVELLLVVHRLQQLLRLLLF